MRFGLVYVSLCSLLIGLFNNAQAQQVTPIVLGNLIVQQPFNGVGNVRKVQTIYTPNDFQNNNVNGLITSLYFRTLGSVVGGLQINQLEIKVRLIPLNGFTTNSFFDSLKTVVFPVPTRTITSNNISGQYVKIELDEPFFYDRNHNLLIEVSTSPGISSFNGAAVNRLGRRLFASSTSAVTGTIDNLQWNVGFDIVEISPNNTKLLNIQTPNALRILSGKQPVRVEFVNASPDTLFNLQFGFQWGNQFVTDNWQGVLNPAMSTSFTFSDSLLANRFQEDTLRVWCSLPNGLTDSITSDDTLSSRHIVSLGNDTILIADQGGEFPTIQAALNYLNVGGILGPVTLELASGVYPGAIVINSSLGLDSLKTLRIRSKAGNADSVVLTNNQGPVLSAQSVNWVQFENIHFIRESNQSGIFGVINLNQTQNWRFDGCKFTVTGNNYLFSPNQQVNFIGSQIRQLDILNSQFTGGSYQFKINNPSNNLPHGIRIENSFFQNAKGGIYELNFVNGFIFKNNVVVKKDTSFINYTQFLHEGGNDIAISENKIDIDNHGSLFYLNGVNRITSQNNLIANNLIKFKLFSLASLLFVDAISQPRVSATFIHNNVEVNSYVNSQFASALMLFGPYTAGSFNQMIVRANIFKWISFGNAQTLFFIRAPSIISALSIDENLYQLPSANRYFFDGVNNNVPFKTIPAFDQQSQLSIFSFDTTSEMQLIGIQNSKLASFSNAVSVDVNGNPRTAPLTDIGAHEKPNTERPILIFEPVADATTLTPYPFSLQVIPSQPVDSVPMTLHYRRTIDTSWVTVPVQRISGNNYGTAFDYGLFPGALFGGVEIIYYFSYANANNQWFTLPFGGNQLTSPSQTFSYKVGKALIGTYYVGANRDFNTLNDASIATQNATISGNVTFLLTDSIYTHNGPTNFFTGYQLIDSTFHVSLQPATNVHVKINLSSSATLPFISIGGATNFSLSARDSFGGGSIEIIQSFNSGLPTIQLTSNGGICKNITIDSLTFSSSFPTNNISAISSVVSGSIRHENVVITNNRFNNHLAAVHLIGIRDLLLQGNTIGHPVDTARSNIYAFLVENCESVTVNNNLVENIAVSRSSFGQISIFRFANVATNLTVTNNIIRNTGFLANLSQSPFEPPTLSGIRLEGNTPNVTVVGNLIDNLRGPQTNLFTGGPVFDIIAINDLRTASSTLPLPQSLIAHNTVIFSENYTGLTFVNSYVYRFANNAIRELYNNTNVLTKTGNPIYLKGAIINVPNHQPALLQQLRSSNNIYITDTAGLFPLYAGGDQIRVDSIETWRRLLATPALQQEQVAFSFKGLRNSFFISPDVPLASFAGYLKANARPIILPPTAVNDLNGQPRGTGVGNGQTADIGAYQISSNVSIDAIPPIFSNLSLDTNKFHCYPNIRSFTVSVIDSGSGVDAVDLSLWNGLLETTIPMSRISGNRQNGIYSASLPVDSIYKKYSVSFSATDSVGNKGFSSQYQDYTDLGNDFRISTRRVISAQNDVIAEVYTPRQFTLSFSEIAFSKTAVGRTPTFPPYVDSTINQFLELTNYGSDTLNLKGAYIVVNGSQTLSINATMLLPPGRVLLISAGSALVDSVNFYIKWPSLFSLTRTNVNQQYLLYSPDSSLADILLINQIQSNLLNYPDFWRGQPLRAISTSSGFKLKGMDMDGSWNWVENSSSSPGSLGTFNAGIPTQETPNFIWGGVLSGTTGNKASRGPLNPGTYLIALQTDFYSCSRYDSITLFVSGTDTLDKIPPILTDLVTSADFLSASCANALRTLSVRVQDTGNGSGIASVWMLQEEPNGNIIRRFMPRESGNHLDGRYMISLGNSPTSGSIKLLSIDNNNNISDSLLVIDFFERTRYRVKASPDTQINLGGSATLFANSSKSDRSAIQITEIIYNALASNSQAASSLPAGMILSGTDDVFEITNRSNDSVYLGGIKMGMSNPNIPSQIMLYDLPEYIIPPREQIFLINSQNAQNGPNIFKLSDISNQLQSFSNVGFFLVDTVGTNHYLSAVAMGTYTFPASLNIPSSLWSGSGVLNTNGTPGMHRISDQPNATSWQRSINAASITNLGSTILLPLPTDTISWFGPSGFIGTGDSIQVSPTQNSIYIARISNATCSAADTVFVGVTGGSNTNDVEVINLVQPSTFTVNNSNVQVIARVKNNGNVPIRSIPMELRVQGQLLAAENISITLQAGDTGFVAFETLWNPPLGEVHNICVNSNLNGDIQAQNDTACVLTLGKSNPNRVQLVQIVNPIANSLIRDSSIVRVTIRNSGTDTLQSVQLAFGESDSTVITQSFNLFLRPGLSQTLTFNRAYVPTDTINTFCIRTVNTPTEQLCIQIGRSTSVNYRADLINHIIAFPNPVADELYIRIPEGLEMRGLEIHDTRGRVILRLKESSEKYFQINTQPLQDGLYFLRINSSAGIVTRKIIVTH